MNHSGSNAPIKNGFLFGIGLAIPITVAVTAAHILFYLGNDFIYGRHTTSFGADIEHTETDFDSLRDWQTDFSGDIAIESVRDTRNGDQVLVLGSITNNGTRPLSSIGLEAEFFDEAGKFVYEESKHISKTLKPGESENFLINCGCKNEKFPDYKTVTVKVTRASAY